MKVPKMRLAQTHIYPVDNGLLKKFRTSDPNIIRSKHHSAQYTRRPRPRYSGHRAAQRACERLPTWRTALRLLRDGSCLNFRLKGPLQPFMKMNSPCACIGNLASDATVPYKNRYGNTRRTSQTHRLHA